MSKRGYINKYIEKYNLYERTHNELYEEYYKIKRSLIENDNKKDRLKLIAIKNIIDIKELDISHKGFNSYPDYNNPNFIYHISHKAEFIYHKKDKSEKKYKIIIPIIIGLIIGYGSGIVTCKLSNFC